jgi:S-adenosylmethionine-dependent methyltransferase
VTRPFGPDAWDAPTWLQQLPTLPGWADERPAGPWNLRGLLRGWDEWPEGMDFLDPESDNHAWKALEDRLYDEPLGGLLTAPGRDLAVLDAACGVGRFALPLAAAGHRVLALDACEPSLRALERRRGDLPITLRWDDVTTAELPGGFDLVLAMELLCYLHEPDATALRLVDALAPGGRLICSVEAWPGALLTDSSGLDASSLTSTIDARVLSIPGERWVRYDTAAELVARLQRAGLTDVAVHGTHYLPDGVFGHAVDLDRIGTAAHDDAVVAAEARLRSHPAIGPLARAWVATGTKSG